MDDVGLARRDDSRGLRDCTKEVYQIDALDTAANYEACMRVMTTMCRYRGPDWDDVLRCCYSIEPQWPHHHSPQQRGEQNKANTTAIIITITPTAINPPNQRCISAAWANVPQRQNLDPVPAAKVALLSVYLRRAPASDI